MGVNHGFRGTFHDNLVVIDGLHNFIEASHPQGEIGIRTRVGFFVVFVLGRKSYLRDR